MATAPSATPEPRIAVYGLLGIPLGVISTLIRRIIVEIAERRADEPPSEGDAAG